MFSAYAIALPPSSALPPASSAPLLVIDAHVAFVALLVSVAVGVGLLVARRRAGDVARRPPLRALDRRTASRHAA
jgi:hypothetical protein